MTDATAAPEAPTQNQPLVDWVEEMAQLTKPKSIHWCDGSAGEYDRLCRRLGLEAGTSGPSPTRSSRAPTWPGRAPPTWRASRGPLAFHLLGDRGWGGAEQQLARARVQ